MSEFIRTAAAYKYLTKNNRGNGSGCCSFLIILFVTLIAFLYSVIYSFIKNEESAIVLTFLIPLFVIMIWIAIVNSKREELFYLDEVTKYLKEIFDKYNNEYDSLINEKNYKYLFAMIDDVKRREIIKCD